MAKPTHADAEIFLRLVELGQSERMVRAIKWFWSELSTKDYEEYKRKYPCGSEGDDCFTTISTFWETVGVLLYYGLINEDLLFDRFMVEPYWEKLKPIVYGMRKAYKEPDIAENFEWLSKRAAKWRKAHRLRMKIK